MFQIKTFTFNPFQENTYLLINEHNEGILIDPGCSNSDEEQELKSFISEHNISLKLLLHTHAHIDHVLGYDFVHRCYGLVTQMHELELPIYRAVKSYAPNYGFIYHEGPEPEILLKDGDSIPFGDDSLEVLFCPGHSPGSIVFYCAKQHFMIVGDVLFYRSIGRTDLPGGHHNTLIDSIKNKLYTLPDETLVFPGHGPQTTIGSEKIYNPFVSI